MSGPLVTAALFVGAYLALRHAVVRTQRLREGMRFAAEDLVAILERRGATLVIFVRVARDAVPGAGPILRAATEAQRDAANAARSLARDPTRAAALADLVAAEDALALALVPLREELGGGEHGALFAAIDELGERVDAGLGTFEAAGEAVHA